MQGGFYFWAQNQQKQNVKRREMIGLSIATKQHRALVFRILADKNFKKVQLALIRMAEQLNMNTL